MENPPLSPAAFENAETVERTVLRSSQRHLRNYNSFDNDTHEERPNDVKQSNGGTAVVVDEVKRLSSPAAPTSPLLVRLPDSNVSVPSKDYDPHDFGNTDNPTSFWGTVSHLIILSFGPAVLTIPRTFQNSGYVTAFFVTFATVFLYAYNMHMLVWSEYKVCKQKRVPNMTYADVLYYSIKEGPAGGQWLAPYARVAAYVVFVTVWFGCTAIALVLMSENFVLVSRNLFGIEVRVRTIMLTLAIPIWLLCCVRRLSYLVPFSVVATAINLLSILVVVYYVCVGPWSTSAQKFGPITNVPLIAGTVLVNLTATGIMMPLKKEMREPHRFNAVFGVLTVSYVPVSMLYAILGSVCSLKYGEDLQSSVIQNLPGKEFLAQATLLLSTLAAVFVYPLASYVIFDVVWNNVLKQKRERLRHTLWWEYAVRTMVVVTSFVGAYTVPNITLFLSLSGTIGTSIDSIIFPALMQTLVVWKVAKNRAKFRRSLYKNAAIIAVALVLMVTGAASCVREIIDSYTGNGSAAVINKLLVPSTSF